ncbi:MAG: hypothetical protein AB1817_12165, partial [Chloroflexota bacterium]
MSKPFPNDQPLARLSPDAQVKYFADMYRPTLDLAAFARFQSRVRDLGLCFDDDELIMFAAFDTPAKVQQFLDAQLYYNDDHISVAQDETAMPPRRVLQTGAAHCFEGALFAYAVNFLHGHDPRFVLLETVQDIEHNLVVVQDAQTKLFGCNAHSTYPGLDGRPAQYVTLRALAESYYPYYYSIRSNDLSDIVLIGYSDPFDLTERFGIAWMASLEPPWDIYYTYIDDSVTFHYLRDDPGTPHLYPLVRALREGWIQIADSEGFVSVRALPKRAQALWRDFWRVHSDATKRPRDAASEIEAEFFRLTGTTPIDLFDHA